jgi:hypothetical protein
MRALRGLVAALGLMFVLSSCEMTVRIATQVNGDGSGRLAMTMAVDQELRGILEATQDNGLTDASGIALLESLYDGLVARGWTVTRSEPAGGLSLDASKAFADKAGFEGLLNDIRTARAGGGSSLGALSFRLDYEHSSSFLRNTARLTGEMDTTGLPELRTDQREALERALRFEIRAELPGSVTMTGGDGTVSDGAVVWRPQLGTRATFGAMGSSMRLGSLMMLMIPGLMLLGGIGWFALGRRKHPALEPADVTVALTPVWTDDLVAIKPDAAPATNGASLDQAPANGALGNGVAAPAISIDLTETPADPPL